MGARKGGSNPINSLQPAADARNTQVAWAQTPLGQTPGSRSPLGSNAAKNLDPCREPPIDGNLAQHTRTTTQIDQGPSYLFPSKCPHLLTCLRLVTFSSPPCLPRLATFKPPPSQAATWMFHPRREVAARLILRSHRRGPNLLRTASANLRYPGRFSPPSPGSEN
jgi:hypothetical protein